MKRFLVFLLILLLLLSVSALAADVPGDEGEEDGPSASASEAAEEAEASGENGSTGDVSREGGDPMGAVGEPDEDTAAENAYVPGQFTDVAEDRWYGVMGQGVIRKVWELGLMEGMGDGTFQPEGSLRLSEAVKLAAVIRSRTLEDGVIFLPTLPWYQTYVDYAEAVGILEPGEFDDLSAYATRGEMAHILARALPEEQLEHINAIFAIPAVISTSTPAVPYSGDILRLYRAGVLWGDAGTHAYRPDDFITRAEAAAAAIRLALPEERQRLELLPVSGGSGKIKEAVLVRDSGEGLCLGYHPWDQFFSFVGDLSAKESADLYLSLDRDESLGYPLFGEEGSLILAEYSDFTLEYMIPDRNPMGVYIFRIESTDPDASDGRGIRIGTPLRSLLQAFPDAELIRESGSSDPVWYSCTPEKPAVTFRYAVSWDGRVCVVSMACAETSAGD